MLHFLDNAVADNIIPDTNLRVTMVDPGDTKTDLFYHLETTDDRIFFVRWYKFLKR